MRLTVVFICFVFALFTLIPHQVSTADVRRNGRERENILLLRRKQVVLVPKKIIFEGPRQAYEDEQEEYEDEVDDDEEAEEELQAALGISGNQAEEEEEGDDEADDAEAEDQEEDEARNFNVEARIFSDKNIEAEEEKSADGHEKLVNIVNRAK